MAAFIQAAFALRRGVPDASEQARQERKPQTFGNGLCQFKALVVTSPDKPLRVERDGDDAIYIKGAQFGMSRQQGAEAMPNLHGAVKFKRKEQLSELSFVETMEHKLRP